MVYNLQVQEMRGQRGLVALIDLNKETKNRRLISNQIYLFLIAIKNLNQTAINNFNQSIKNLWKFPKEVKRLL